MADAAEAGAVPLAQRRAVARRARGGRGRGAAGDRLVERPHRPGRLRRAGSTSRGDGLLPGSDAQPGDRRRCRQCRHGGLDVRRRHACQRRAVGAGRGRGGLGLWHRAGGVSRAAAQRCGAPVGGGAADLGRAAARAGRRRRTCRAGACGWPVPGRAGCRIVGYPRKPARARTARRLLPCAVGLCRRRRRRQTGGSTAGCVPGDRCAAGSQPAAARAGQAAPRRPARRGRAAARLDRSARPGRRGRPGDRAWAAACRGRDRRPARAGRHRTRQPASGPRGDRRRGRQRRGRDARVRRLPVALDSRGAVRTVARGRRRPARARGRGDGCARAGHRRRSAHAALTRRRRSDLAHSEGQHDALDGGRPTRGSLGGDRRSCRSARPGHQARRGTLGRADHLPCPQARLQHHGVPGCAASDRNRVRGRLGRGPRPARTPRPGRACDRRRRRRLGGLCPVRRQLPAVQRLPDDVHRRPARDPRHARGADGLGTTDRHRDRIGVGTARILPLAHVGGSHSAGEVRAAVGGPPRLLDSGARGALAPGRRRSGSPARAASRGAARPRRCRGLRGALVRRAGTPAPDRGACDVGDGAGHQAGAGGAGAARAGLDPRSIPQRGRRRSQWRGRQSPTRRVRRRRRRDRQRPGSGAEDAAQAGGDPRTATALHTPAG